MRIHQARYVGKLIQAPDVFNDGVRIPSGSAEPRARAQLGFDVAVGQWIGETASRGHHGLAERFAGCQMDDDAGRAIGEGSIELRPHLLAQRYDVGPGDDRFSKFRDSRGAEQQGAGGAMMNADSRIALAPNGAVAAREQQRRALYRDG